MMLVGDATSMPLKTQSVHCIVTSPPYNVSIPYEGYDDQLPWVDYRRMAIDASREMARVLVPGGRVWLNVQGVTPIGKGDNSRRYALGALWHTCLAEAGLFFRDEIAWIQDSYDGGCAWGSWLQPSAPNTRGSWEKILCFYRGPSWKRDTPLDWKGWRAPREELGGEWMDLCRNVWKLPPVPRKFGPAPFPVELPARAIRLSTWPGEVVLDPFVGTGQTLRAAASLDRIGIGFDISPEQVASAL